MGQEATLTEGDHILVFLGGRRALSAGRRGGEPDFVELVRKGFPASAFRHASEHLQLPAGELTKSLGLARRTVTRRKERLTTAESSRLFRLARIFVRAAQILDGERAAANWLRRPQRALGGAVPVSLLDTDAGALAVERLLGRIEDSVVT